MPKMTRGRDAFLRFLFLEGHGGIVEAHLARHRFREDLLERVHGFARAEAGRGGGVDLRGAIEIETHGEFRAAARLHTGDGAERDHLVVGVPHIEEADVLRLGPELAFGLDEDLPLPAEAIEVVHEVAAHEGLQRLADLREIDALLQDLVAIDVDEDLRHGGQEGAGRGGDLRAFAHGFEEAVQVFAEEGRIAAGAIFEHEGDAAGGADAGNRRAAGRRSRCHQEWRRAFG